MSEPVARRIGDSERDQAAELLRDHMAAGRLEHAEFDERLGQALVARTQPELDALFVDLPTLRPGEGAGAYPGAGMARPGPAPLAPDPSAMPEPRPWWTHWGVFAAALMLTVLTRGRMGPLVAFAAVWTFWLAPSIWQHQQARRRFEADRRRRELGH